MSWVEEQNKYESVGFKKALELLKSVKGKDSLDGDKVYELMEEAYSELYEPDQKKKVA